MGGRSILRFWPGVIALAVIGVAAMLLGADSPAASLTLSASLLALAALRALQVRLCLGGFAIVAGQQYLLFLGIAVGSGFLAVGAPEYASLAACGAVFLIAREQGRNPDDAGVYWLLTSALFGGIAAYAFADHVLAPGRLWLAEAPYNPERLSAPFLSANTAGTFYGLGAIVALGALFRAMRLADRATGTGRIEGIARNAAGPAMILLVTGFVMFLTGSRAAISLAAAGLIALTIWEYHPQLVKRGPAVYGLAAGLTAVLLVMQFVAVGDLYAARLESAGADAASRLKQYAAYAEALGRAGAFGYGLGGFDFFNDRVITQDNALVLIYQHAAHNIALQWIIQAGFLGAAVMAGVMGAILWRLFTAARRRRRRASGLLRTSSVAAVFVLAHGMVDFGLEIPAMAWVFAWLLGLGAGAASSKGSIADPGLDRALHYVAAATFAACAIGFSAIAADRMRAADVAAMGDPGFRLAAEAGRLEGGSFLVREAVGDRALRLSPPEPGMAASAFEEAVEREPRDGETWAKLAYARYLEDGALAPDALFALQRSYELTPFADYAFGRWRVAFAARVWPQLPAPLQARADAEARLMRQPEYEAWRRDTLRASSR